MAWWQRLRWQRKTPRQALPIDNRRAVSDERSGALEPDAPSEHGQEPTGEDAEGLVVEITDVLDLHAFAPRDIAIVVEIYLQEVRAKGYSTVRIIHGKGIGVQRERVRAVLQQTPVVASFADAPLEAGSWGATVVWLK